MPHLSEVDWVVDVHSHLYVPTYVGYLRSRQTPPYIRQVDGRERFVIFSGDHGVLLDRGFTSVAGKVTYMNEVGIDHSVLSLGNPWLDVESGHYTVELAAQINAELLEAAQQDPNRLSTMGVLPNHTVESAIATVRELGQGSGHVGVVTSTRICGYELDHPDLEPLWNEIAFFQLPVLVHPLRGLGGEMTTGYGQALTLGLSFPFETTAAVCRMMLAGLFEKNPGLDVIAAHGAGTIPYLYGRLQRANDADPLGAKLNGNLPNGLHADSILFSEAALRECIDVFGAHNVMFGTDHPFPIADAQGGLRDIASVTVNRPDVRTAILSANAQKLLSLPPASRYQQTARNKERNEEANKGK